MHPCHHALVMPDKPAIVMTGSGQTMTYRELEDASNRGAHLFRSLGLRAGDHIAILMENHLRFYEVCFAAQRSGLIYTAISTRLTATEVAYIVADCQARVLVTTRAMAALAEELTGQMPGVLARLMIDGTIGGYDSWDEAVAAQPSTRISDESAGGDMLYSSGTTGRPKGVFVPPDQPAIDAANPLMELSRRVYGVDPETRYLSPAPLYHAAPLRFNMMVLRLGGTCFIMEHFDAEDYLRQVQAHRITHSQLVPTMFVRMLKLPPEVRSAYDLSSLKVAIHAAAPCPVPVKEQMIAWWGPILWEYYAGTEGNGMTMIDSTQWLEHRGSVGRAMIGRLRICGDDGEELPAGEAGTVYFSDGRPFAYHNDPKKTAESTNQHGWTTLGDVGYVDAEGWLFLTDRKAFMIISGGVNIYPQEAENVLITHPAVTDVAVFGVPNEEFGEEVKAVVQPRDMAQAGPELERELIEYCRTQLSALKSPRSIDFEAELPRHPTGKLYKRVLRDRYWKGHASRIV